MNILEDFKKSYEETIVRVKINGKFIPISVYEVDIDSETIRGNIIKNGSWVQWSGKYHDSEFNLGLPEVGFRNVTISGINVAVSIYRGNSRQWRKGMCSRTVGISFISSRLSGKSDYSSELVEQLYTYPSYTIPYSKIRDTEVASVAISNKLALVREPSGYISVIYGDADNFVGILNEEDTVVLRRHSSILSSYVSKFIPCVVE